MCGWLQFLPLFPLKECKWSLGWAVMYSSISLCVFCTRPKRTQTQTHTQSMATNRIGWVFFFQQIQKTLSTSFHFFTLGLWMVSKKGKLWWEASHKGAIKPCSAPIYTVNSSHVYRERVGGFHLTEWHIICLVRMHYFLFRRYSVGLREKPKIVISNLLLWAILRLYVCLNKRRLCPALTIFVLEIHNCGLLNATSSSPILFYLSVCALLIWSIISFKTGILFSLFHREIIFVHPLCLK